MIGLVLLAELAIVVGGWTLAPDAAQVAAAHTPDPGAISNTHALGALIYTHYIYLFQAAGMILLVAMIGAIVLTHRRRPVCGGKRSPIRSDAARPRRSKW